MNRIFLLLIAFSLSVYQSTAQNMDSLMQNISSEQDTGGVTASFKSTRLILSQTTTMVKRYDLDFKVIQTGDQELSMDLIIQATFILALSME